MNTKRFLTWFSFIVIVGLIVWGLIAAEQKSEREMVSVLLPSEIVAADHIRGVDTAPVTLVEYGDFQCPACGAFHPIVEQVLAGYSTTTVRFVFRHFPLTQHPNAVPAAQASEAASNQGKFWEMYNILYDKQSEWQDSKDSKTIFVGYAKTLGLDEKKFSDDYELQVTKDIIDKDYKSGQKAGINATPTFFLNGKQIDSPQSYEAFKKLIDDTLPKISL